MLSAFDMVADAHRARARTLSLVAAARNTRSDLPSWKRNTNCAPKYNNKKNNEKRS